VTPQISIIYLLLRNQSSSRNALFVKNAQLQEMNLRHFPLKLGHCVLLLIDSDMAVIVSHCERLMPHPLIDNERMYTGSWPLFVLGSFAPFC